MLTQDLEIFMSASTDSHFHPNLRFLKWWFNPVLKISCGLFVLGCAIIIVCVLTRIASWNLLTGWLLGWTFSWLGFGLRNMCVVLTLRMMNKYFILTSFLLRMLFYTIAGLIYYEHQQLFNPLLMIGGLLVFHFALYGWLILGDLKKKYNRQRLLRLNQHHAKINEGAYAIF